MSQKASVAGASTLDQAYGHAPMINRAMPPIQPVTNALNTPRPSTMVPPHPAMSPSIASAPSYSAPSNFTQGMSQQAYTQMANSPFFSQMNNLPSSGNGFSGFNGSSGAPVPPPLPLQAVPPRPAQAVMTGMPQVQRPAPWAPPAAPAAPAWNAPMASDYQNSLLGQGTSQQRQFQYF